MTRMLLYIESSAWSKQVPYNFSYILIIFWMKILSYNVIHIAKYKTICLSLYWTLCTWILSKTINPRMWQMFTWYNISQLTDKESFWRWERKRFFKTLLSTEVYERSLSDSWNSFLLKSESWHLTASFSWFYCAYLELCSMWEIKSAW